MNQGTQVLVTGCSAGGLSTYLHLDYVRKKVPTNIKVKGVPDAGYFLDVPNWYVQKVEALCLRVLSLVSGRNPFSEDSHAAVFDM